ncbi:hypothetical protein NLJ89_g4703 [Agrocybe chaxingu]|uniref:Uncharacterized protein n=1 Tax=Agrocybe chaxingu TaxID=84603 RepID=A0A9W8MW99_9AGAR|nr:hypothetical protein NLJ89_g4703 [Agrocybe chaxingu]
MADRGCNNARLVVAAHDSPGSSVFDLPVVPVSMTVNTSQVSLLTSTTTEPHSTRDLPAGEPSLLVISGGTGGNAFCSAFRNACYVLPVSDDGGSSSEIIRVLGGPSVGDIRSRLVRLIPPAPISSPLDAIRQLLAYRLPSRCSEREAREEWRDIVEGRSLLWNGVPSDRKETIRGFLVYFEITNHTVTIAAELEDGQKLVGQCEISHPVVPTELSFQVREEEEPTSPIDGLGEVISPRQNVMFESLTKGTHEPLPSRISRLYYINGYGMEIHPSPNGEFLSSLASKDILIYSCGSLWTSIIPCLALRGVAGAIARSSSLRAKVLLLNTENDRETEGYTAADYIQSIVRTLNTNYSNQAYGLGGANTTYPVSAFITDLVYLKGTQIVIDVKRITSPIHTDLFAGASRRGSSSSSERSALSILMASHASPTAQVCISEFNALPLESEPAPAKRPPPADVITSNPGNSISRSPDMILSSSTDDNSFDELVTPLSEEPPERPTNRVRFRSRVRITSGFSRHRHRQDGQDYLSLTPSSSHSGSPSSSISAPLRSHPEDEVAKPGWGTLGQRVSLLAQGGSLRKKQRREAEMYAKNIERGMVVAANVNGRMNERTALLSASAVPLYINGEVNGIAGNSSLDEEASISREVDLIFGPWPNRIFKPSCILFFPFHDACIN